MFDTGRAATLASNDGLGEFRRARARSFERHESRWPGALADPYDLLDPLKLDPADVLAIETATAGIGAIYARLLPLLRNLSDDTLLAMGVRPETLELTRTQIPGLELPLLARLDLAQTPDGLKLLEYNGEAPGLVVETFGLNALECADAGMRDVNAGSLALLTTAMRAALQRGIDHVGPADRALVAFAYNLRSDRGRAAARYLAQVARDSSSVDVVDAPIESLALSDEHLRLQDGRPVTVLWRPCSARYLGAALSPSDAPPDECAASIARLIRQRRLAVLDAPDTSLLSSKAAQAVIWGLAQTGGYFSDAESEIVRAYFLPTALDPPAGIEPYVIKPAFGSEGDSITIVDPVRGDVRRSTCTSYQGEAHVHQQFVALPTTNLMTEHGVRTLHLVASCFLVSGRPSGIIFRAGGEITGDDAWVVPAGW